MGAAKIVITVAAAALQMVSAIAAEIQVVPPNSERPARVIVTGRFNAEDAEQFQRKVAFLERASVVFMSDGGSMFAGIQMGQIIRMKNFTTEAVVLCASACADAWLGGTTRYIWDAARVGFHAPYGPDGKEWGTGQAISGGYYANLGLSYKAIIYLSEVPPNSIRWLTPEDSKSVGIDAIWLNTPAPAQNTDGSLEVRARQFLIAFLEKSSETGSSALEWFRAQYADNVRFYSKDWTRQMVMEDKSKYFARWPRRTYQLRMNSLSVDCKPNFSAPFCVVKGLIDFQVWSGNGNHSISGVANQIFWVAFPGGSAMIVSEDGQVISSQKHTFGQAPLPSNQFRRQ